MAVFFGKTCNVLKKPASQNEMELCVSPVFPEKMEGITTAMDPIFALIYIGLDYWNTLSHCV